MAARSTLLRDQNPPASTINPAIGHLFQHLSGYKQQSTLDSQSNEEDDCVHPPPLLCVVRLS